MASIQLSIEVYLDDAAARLLAAQTQTTAEETTKLIETNKQAQIESYHHIMSNMRGAYLIMTGLGRIMGGGMTMAFRTMYTIGTSLITSYTAISAAIAQIPGAQVQAALAIAGLAFASIQMFGVLTQQDELTQTMRGFYMSLHGISNMIAGGYYT